MKLKLLALPGNNCVLLIQFHLKTKIPKDAYFHSVLKEKLTLTVQPITHLTRPNGVQQKLNLTARLYGVNGVIVTKNH